MEFHGSAGPRSWGEGCRDPSVPGVASTGRSHGAFAKRSKGYSGPPIVEGLWIGMAVARIAPAVTVSPYGVAGLSWPSHRVASQGSRRRAPQNSPSEQGVACAHEEPPALVPQALRCHAGQVRIEVLARLGFEERRDLVVAPWVLVGPLG